ncbi:MAG: hypothetical protein M3Z92_14650, partial [Bacteroidota bacterium]|nr:hypothetical protein [Bacteroidota bacterium]
MKHFTAAELADLLPKEAGNNFKIENSREVSETVLDVLKSNLQNYSFDELEVAYHKATRHSRNPISWRKLFCLILSHLHGKWTKLNNNPGINASTMFLLTDGT